MVPLDIQSNVDFLRSFGRTDVDRYAPLLDMRRRIIANAWVRTLDIRGPGSTTMTLSADLFRENAASCPYTSYTCATTPAADRDRTEVYKGWNYTTPTDQVFGNGLNRTSGARDTLTVSMTGTESMLFPGAHFRFLTGPAVSYPGGTSRRWSNMPIQPTGEATGFIVNQAFLAPANPQVRGNTNPLTLTAYERATILLIGNGAGQGTGSQDSVTFYVDPAVAQPTVAAWRTGGSGYIYARCGALPGPYAYDHRIFLSTTGVLDLTAGCPSYWIVTVVNDSVNPSQVNVRIGSLRSPDRNFNLIVGYESQPSAGEQQYVERVMRAGAWWFYGAMGGTHMVRTLTYHEGGCGGAHVCFRNRSTCSPAAITHPSGGTPSIAIDICRNISGWDAGPTHDLQLHQDAGTMAHEFGHLLTGNGSLNYLMDEYWTSRWDAEICGENPITIHRCNYTIMAGGWRSVGLRRNSICVHANHMAAPQVFQHGGGTNVVPLGSTSVGWGTPTWTYTECSDGSSVNEAGYDSADGWGRLQSNGSRAHPTWTADNHSFWSFATPGTSNVIGQNL